MAKDVAAFLTWTAEPTLVKRKQTGWPVLGFLLFATILATRLSQVWADRSTESGAPSVERPCISGARDVCWETP